jgi:quercetin dioxygenase-like cupin family protein
MQQVRRRFLQMTGAALTASAVSPAAWPRTPSGAPKASEILRKDLEGQGQKVEETVVTMVEFAPGAAAPWHAHPGAQELVFGIEGRLMVEADGQPLTTINVGDIGVIPADVFHSVRNESTSVMGKIVVVYSRSDKAKPLIVLARKS